MSLKNENIPSTLTYSTCNWQIKVSTNISTSIIFQESLGDLLKIIQQTSQSPHHYIFSPNFFLFFPFYVNSSCSTTVPKDQGLSFALKHYCQSLKTTRFHFKCIGFLEKWSYQWKRAASPLSSNAHHLFEVSSLPYNRADFTNSKRFESLS